MNKESIKEQSQTRPETMKSVGISIKISPRAQKWLKKEGYSPTVIFMAALKELGFEDGRN